MEDQESTAKPKGQERKQLPKFPRKAPSRRTVLEVMKHDTKGLVVKHHIPLKRFLKRKEHQEFAYRQTLEHLHNLRNEEMRTKSPRQMNVRNYEYSMQLLAIKVYDEEKLEQGILYEYALLFHFGSSYRNEHLTMQQGYENAIHDIELLFDKLMW